MNIAFYTYNDCCPTIGGTERTTALVADTLRKNYGHNVFSVYSSSVNDQIEHYDFDGKYQIKGTEDYDGLMDFMTSNNISVVINQGGFGFERMLTKIRKKYSLGFKQVFALHFAPGSFEEAHISFGERLKKWKKKKNVSEFFKLASYPAYYMLMHRIMQQKYKNVERNVDAVVLLSESFKPEWDRYSHGKSSNLRHQNMLAIPNGLSYQFFASKQDIENKKKRVLIVGRMDENQKKISKALDIWMNVTKDGNLSDWSLDIVGDGTDLDRYKAYVKDKNISRVTFYGRQDPKEHYLRSAIFLMTSDFEGFGMTLTEASQFGVVPLAYNTFSSLKDIIDTGVNGFIINPDDSKSYEKRLYDLMSDKVLRETMAIQAVKNSRRYALDKIGELWESLIASL